MFIGVLVLSLFVDRKESGERETFGDIEKERLVSVGWRIIPWTKGLWVKFPIRTHAWIVGSFPGQKATN